MSSFHRLFSIPFLYNYVIDIMSSLYVLIFLSRSEFGLCGDADEQVLQPQPCDLPAQAGAALRWLDHSGPFAPGGPGWLGASEEEPSGGLAFQGEYLHQQEPLSARPLGSLELTTESFESLAELVRKCGERLGHEEVTRALQRQQAHNAAQSTA